MAKITITIDHRRIDPLSIHSSPPRLGSSPVPSVYGGAQRGISLATGFFTGESRRNVNIRRGTRLRGLDRFLLGLPVPWEQFRQA
jgi:hypothetical protein